jgi:hypothetical protein
MPNLKSSMRLKKTKFKDIACGQSLTVPGLAPVPKNLIQRLFGENSRRFSRINPEPLERILIIEKHVVQSSFD